MRKLLALLTALCLGLPAEAQSIGGTILPQSGSMVGNSAAYAPGTTSPVTNVPDAGVITNARNIILESPYQLNTFITGQTISFTLVEAINGNTGNTGATFYRCLDVNGNLIASGPVSGTSLTLPSITKLGWYEVELLGPSIDPKTGNSYGFGTFAVVANDSHFQTPASGFATNLNYPQDPRLSNSSPSLHALYDIGPERFSIAQNGGITGTPSQSQTLANDYQTDLTFDAANGWLSIATDSARPRKHFISFPYFDGSSNDQTCATDVAAILGNQVYYIGQNEPQGYSGGPAAYATVSNSFYSAVKSGASSAQVVGPSIVGYGNGGIRTWLSTFLGASPNLDGISYHDYNMYCGDDLIEGDYSGALFVSDVTAAGYGSKPRFDDEDGNQGFITDIGPYFPRRQLRQLLAETLQQEFYGCPKEHKAFFYPRINGFWMFPSFLCNYNGTINAAPVGYRALTEALWGTNPQSTAINFGAAADYLRGYQYSISGGGYVTALLTSASENLPITISGATSATDVFGNAITLTANYPLGDLPIYVYSNSPLTITDVGNGLMSATNVATSATATVPVGQSSLNVALINDGLLTSPYWNGVDGGAPPTYNTSTQCYGDYNNNMPGQATITWGSAQTIKRIGLFFARPWHQQNAGIAFNVQAFTGGTWNTIWSSTDASAYSEPYCFEDANSYTQTFWDGQYIYHTYLASPVTTTALRVNVTNAGLGDVPDLLGNLMNPIGGQNNGIVGRLTLNDFRAYTN